MHKNKIPYQSIKKGNHTPQNVDMVKILVCQQNETRIEINPECRNCLSKRGKHSSGCIRLVTDNLRSSLYLYGSIERVNNG